MDADLLVTSQKRHGITLVGPTRANNTWQTKVEGAYDLDQFVIDWEQQQVRCPQGHASTAWKEGVDTTGSPLILTYFRRKDCQACPARTLCTKARRRVIGFRPRAQYEALRATRQRHASPEGKQLYNRRAGIEGTISQGVRAFGVRFCRYRGLAKTHLQQVATATAINLDRLANWFHQIPHAKTRTSRFASLAPA